MRDAIRDLVLVFVLGCILAILLGMAMVIGQGNVDYNVKHPTIVTLSNN